MRSIWSRSVLVAVVLLVLFPLADAFACTVAPGHLRTHYTNLIDRTPAIVLAEAVGAEELAVQRVGDDFSFPPRVRYDFSVIETLKGGSESKISLTFTRHDWTTPPIDHDFDRHRDPLVWDRKATRQWNEGDCRMNPVFFVGSRYLLFLNAPYHWRSFERITAADDRWLTTVRARVRSGAELSQTTLEWLKDKAGLVLYRVDRCPATYADRATLTRLQTLKGVSPFTSDWEPSFVGRAGCRPGHVVLAIHYGRYEEGSVTTYPVVDGVIDLTHAQTEIKLVGPRRLPLADLKAVLR